MATDSPQRPQDGIRHLGPEARGPLFSQTPPSPAPEPGRAGTGIRLNLVLFLATVLTTMMAGAFHEGVDPFVSLSNFLKGLPFSAALLGILMAHEMGHYLTSHRHGVKASFPYFIPVPSWIGTFGAVIFMRSRVRNRKFLFDIGIAGPLAGMAVAIPVTIYGLLHSTIISVGPTPAGISLGDSLLIKVLIGWLFGGLTDSQTVLLHPVAFAGWLGFFVTSLNLVPVGQLDGGHVLYGIFGRHHRSISGLVFLCLLLWGVHGAFSVLKPLHWIWAVAFCWAVIRMAFSPQQGYVLRGITVFLLGCGIYLSSTDDRLAATFIWILWAAILSFLRVDHPPTLDVHIPLDRTRKVLGWITLILFLLTFIPRPFQGF